MIVIISPAKTLDFSKEDNITNPTQPFFKREAAVLMNELKKHNPAALSKLMNISPKLSELNSLRHQNWEEKHTNNNSKPNIFAFKGEVFNGLEVKQFDKKALQFAQNHLRILSGLYGVLRPLDLIQPYRLEMGTKLLNPQGKNLYEFWDTKITEILNNHAQKTGTNTLINLASNEYFKAVKKENLNLNIIKPIFKEFKNGRYKTISIYAKKARGLMSAYIIRNSITHAEKLKIFNEANYMFDTNHSTATEWVFTR